MFLNSAIPVFRSILHKFNCISFFLDTTFFWRLRVQRSYVGAEGICQNCNFPVFRRLSLKISKVMDLFFNSKCISRAPVLHIVSRECRRSEEIVTVKACKITRSLGRFSKPFFEKIGLSAHVRKQSTGLRHVCIGNLSIGEYMVAMRNEHPTIRLAWKSSRAG